MGTNMTSNTTRKGAEAGETRERQRGRVVDSVIEVTPERIRARAYELFETRRATGAVGDAATDWMQAEQELAALAIGASFDARTSTQGPDGRAFARGA